MFQLAALLSSPASATSSTDLASLTNRLRTRTGDASPQLTGLVISEILDHLTESKDARRLIQVWWSPRSDAGLHVLEEVVQVSEQSGATVDAWVVQELIFRQPVERENTDASRAGVKLANTAYKRDDFTLEGFFDYWKNVHAPISATVPGFGGYVVSRITEQLTGDLRPDALCELWFPDHTTFNAFEASPELAEAEVDTARYAKMTGTHWLMKETVLIPPPSTGPGTLEIGGA